MGWSTGGQLIQACIKLLAQAAVGCPAVKQLTQAVIKLTQAASFFSVMNLYLNHTLPQAISFSFLQPKKYICVEIRYQWHHDSELKKLLNMHGNNINY